MKIGLVNLNDDVTAFWDSQDHPFRKEIEQLRLLILSTDQEISENIKWNGPNYCFKNQDRLTMRIQPPKQVQLIFHRGAKVKEQPIERLIKDSSNLLIWKENDRAIASFKSMKEIENRKEDLKKNVTDWINVAS